MKKQNKFIRLYCSFSPLIRLNICAPSMVQTVPKTVAKSFDLSCMQQCAHLFWKNSPGLVIQVKINLARKRISNKRGIFSKYFLLLSTHIAKNTQKLTVKTISRIEFLSTSKPKRPNCKYLICQIIQLGFGMNCEWMKFCFLLLLFFSVCKLILRNQHLQVWIQIFKQQHRWRQKQQQQCQVHRQVLMILNKLAIILSR